MCNSRYHLQPCYCGFGGVGHLGRSSGNSSHGSSSFNALENKLKQFVEYFSTTHPNAICKYCGNKIFFYQNSFGSKVFFDELGKPWTKHKHYYSDESLLIPKELDLKNIPELNFKCKDNSSENNSIAPQIVTKYLKEYKEISFIDPSNNKTENYLINFSSSDFGICFKVNENNQTYLEGYNNLGKYSIVCIKIEKNFKSNFKNIFPPEQGDVINVNVSINNLIISKGKIEFNFLNIVNGSEIYEYGFIRFGKLKKGSLQKIYLERELILKVSFLIKENEKKEFYEV